jgi:hypothetical protein
MADELFNAQAAGNVRIECFPFMIPFFVTVLVLFRASLLFR